MSNKLFWTAVLLVVVAAGVQYWRWTTQWRIVVEDAPFVDRQGRTPTKEEIAERMIEAYTKCRYLSFDYEGYHHLNRYWQAARYRAAAGKCKTELRVGRLSILGRGEEYFTLTKRIKAGTIHEEWVRAKDGSRLATTYPIPGPLDSSAFRLADSVPEYICGMAGGGITDTTVDNAEAFTLKAHVRYVRDGAIVGTMVVGGERCAVVYCEGPEAAWAVRLVVNPDYFVFQWNTYLRGRFGWVSRYTNFSTQPIPDSAWE